MVTGATISYVTLNPRFAAELRRNVYGWQELPAAVASAIPALQGHPAYVRDLLHLQLLLNQRVRFNGRLLQNGPEVMTQHILEALGFAVAYVPPMNTLSGDDIKSLLIEGGVLEKKQRLAQRRVITLSTPAPDRIGKDVLALLRFKGAVEAGTDDSPTPDRLAEIVERKVRNRGKDLDLALFQKNFETATAEIRKAYVTALQKGACPALINEVRSLERYLEEQIDKFATVPTESLKVSEVQEQIGFCARKAAALAKVAENRNGLNSSAMALPPGAPPLTQAVWTKLKQHLLGKNKTKRRVGEDKPLDYLSIKYILEIGREAIRLGNYRFDLSAFTGQILVPYEDLAEVYDSRTGEWLGAFQYSNLLAGRTRVIKAGALRFDICRVRKPGGSNRQLIFRGRKLCFKKTSGGGAIHQRLTAAKCIALFDSLNVFDDQNSNLGVIDIESGLTADQENVNAYLDGLEHYSLIRHLGRGIFVIDRVNYRVARAGNKKGDDLKWEPSRALVCRQLGIALVYAADHYLGYFKLRQAPAGKCLTVRLEDMLLEVPRLRALLPTKESHAVQAKKGCYVRLGEWAAGQKYYAIRYFEKGGAGKIVSDELVIYDNNDCEVGRINIKDRTGDIPLEETAILVPALTPERVEVTSTSKEMRTFKIGGLTVFVGKHSRRIKGTAFLRPPDRSAYLTYKDRVVILEHNPWDQTYVSAASLFYPFEPLPQYRGTFPRPRPQNRIFNVPAGHFVVPFSLTHYGYFSEDGDLKQVFDPWQLKRGNFATIFENPRAKLAGATIESINTVYRLLYENGVVLENRPRTHLLTYAQLAAAHAFISREGAEAFAKMLQRGGRFFVRVIAGPEAVAA